MMPLVSGPPRVARGSSPRSRRGAGWGSWARKLPLTHSGDLHPTDQALRLLEQALDLADEERSAFVRRACAGAPELRSRLERLLRDATAHDPRFDGGLLGGDLIRDLVSDVTPWEPEPGSQVGPYQVIERLGSGGMGVVFRAHDPRLDRAVALKILSKSVHADRQRFAREARAASALNHPHIATVYELGEADGVAYIAMELVEGPSLQALLRAGPLPLGEALEIAAQIAAALAAAHSRGVVHRDLKPGNVVLCPERGVKLVDFGLAKREGRASGDSTEGSLTADGLILGTVGYMSPEQAAGQAVDFRSDQFSLGAMLYEMVAGRRPFVGGSTAETLAAILRDAPPPLRELAPGVPAWLAAVIQRCLAKAPADRYTGTEELARALHGSRAAERAEGHREPTRPCAGCGSRIGVAHRYCPACGRPQGATCGGCGRELDPVDRYCPGCGAARPAPRPDLAPTVVRSAPSAVAATGQRSLVGERRPVTAVVSRLAGYARLLDEVGPDERRSRLAAVEAGVRSVAEPEGGRLVRFAGDELLLVFGLDGAREDDAERALRVAHRLHGTPEVAAGGTPIAVHGLEPCTGVHSGMAICEPGSEDQPQVAGAAVENAQRLARRAAAGEILVSSETRRLTTGSGSRSAVFPKAGAGDGDGAGLSAFTGRRAELHALLDAVAASARGEGRFFEVVGDAGSGKSRLLFELSRQAPWEGCRLVVGRCQSYGASTPYLPLIEVLRTLVGFDPGASEERQRETVEAVLRDLGSDLDRYLALFLHLLSPSAGEREQPHYLDRKYLRHTLQSALVGLITLSADRRPIVLLLEDWHWADEASHEVVRQLAELTSAHPLSVIVSRRPEAPPKWPPLAAPVTLSLGPLSVESAEAVVRSVVGAQDLDPQVIAALHARSGGNPFFLEELARSLLEEGLLERAGGRVRAKGPVESLELPATLHAVLHARLDRVTGAARDVLRRAAVIGREFSSDVLAATLEAGTDLEAALEQLKSRGLVRQLRVFPHPEYTFQHILVQEAAYESLLRHQRVALHGEVGRAIERVHAGRLEEHLSRLADHFAQAECWAEAVHYGSRAARRAGDLCHLGEALAMIDRSLEWLDRCPQGAKPSAEGLRLLLDKERLCETLGWRDEQERLIRELLSMLAPRGDSPELVDVLIRQGELQAQLGGHAEADAVLHEALAMTRRLGDELRERNTLRGLSFLRWHQQRLEDVVELLQQALELDRKLGDRRAEVQELANIGTTLRRLDRQLEALEILHRAQDLNREVRDPLRETNILYMLGWVYRSLGDVGRARECLDRFDDVAGQGAIERPYQLTTLASMALEQGEVEESLEILQQSVAGCRASRYRAGLAHSLRALAETLIQAGRADQGLEPGLEAGDLFAQLGERDSELRMRVVCAPMLERREDPRAAAHWDRVVELSRGVERPDLEAEGLLGRARGLAASDRLAEARTALLEALAAVDGVAEERVAEVLNQLGIVEWRLGRLPEALTRYQRALEIFRRLGDRAHQGLMLNSIGATLRKLERAEEAAAILLQAEAVHRESGEELLRGHAAALLGDLERDAGRSEEARRWYEQSLDIRRAIGDLQGEAWMCLRLAEVTATPGPSAQAREWLQSAADVAARLGDETIGAECTRLRERLGGSDA
ncbi:MAG TPA: tetratricopeptide repeat protein [Thermoanaerobaculia bacterium]|nr:tetratricopeptide repeat protein [Thermoanaerobaculia bacterium]